ncbi:hypothetical protein VZT92_011252 [Zoarces viviparus]|uniref:Uncharacterized protein n=1 Tax=Zoarces viviparus TaxID=48416 RepID=A0AAW1FBG5_ZOAVI
MRVLFVPSSRRAFLRTTSRYSVANAAGVRPSYRDAVNALCVCRLLFCLKSLFNSRIGAFLHVSPPLVDAGGGGQADSEDMEALRLCRGREL